MTHIVISTFLWITILQEQKFCSWPNNNVLLGPVLIRSLNFEESNLVLGTHEFMETTKFCCELKGWVTKSISITSNKTIQKWISFYESPDPIFHAVEIRMRGSTPGSDEGCTRRRRQPAALRRRLCTTGRCKNVALGTRHHFYPEIFLSACPKIFLKTYLAVFEEPQNRPFTNTFV